MSKKLKFKIGEQYEKYEFELDWLKSVLDDNLRYEVYQYIGKDIISIFDCEVQKILLAYNCDFLFGVFYFVENSNFDEQMEFSNTRKRRRKINVVKLNNKISVIYVTAKKIKFGILIDVIIKWGEYASRNI